MSKNKQGGSTVVCVLGMHRSGTSMVMRILDICGVHIGEESDLYQDYTGNKMGHWESLEVLNINRKILKIFKGSYENPPKFPAKWEESSKLKDIRKRAREFVKKMDSKNTIWGFKEPRTCLTLPFWKKIMPHMVYIVPIRHPLEVALSLKKRNKFPLRKGFLLWINYWMHIVKNTEGETRYFTLFEDYFKDWKGELGKLLKFINHPGISSKGKEKEIKDFINPSMFHQKSKDKSAFKVNLKSLNRDNDTFLKSLLEDINFSANYMYQDSEKEIKRINDDIYSLIVTNNYRKEFIKEKKVLLEVIKEKQEIIDQKRQEATHFRNLFSQKKHEAANFNNLLKDKEIEADNLGNMFREKQEEVRAKDRVIEMNSQAIYKRNKIISSMRSSKFWKMRNIYISLKRKLGFKKGKSRKANG